MRLLILVTLLLAGCDKRPDYWSAFVTYQEDPERLEVIEGFKTFELCQKASLQRLRAEGVADTGYWECGRRCRPPTKQMDLWVCEETRD